MPMTASTPKCDRHRTHVGACAACQRVQLARWREQLIDAEAARRSGRRDAAAGIGGAMLRATTSIG
jgi:hypothetical protein